MKFPRVITRSAPAALADCSRPTSTRGPQATTLGGVATLDYTNLSPWAFIDRKLLVVFGPAGSEGIISIDGRQYHVTVPTVCVVAGVRGLSSSDDANRRNGPSACRAKAGEGGRRRI